MSPRTPKASQKFKSRVSLSMITPQRKRIVEIPIDKDVD